MGVELNFPRIARYMTAFLSCALMSGCWSSGPVGVDPDRSFSGIRDILSDVPEGGIVDIFMIHGMRADQPQTYSDVIGQLVERLTLTSAPDDPSDHHSGKPYRLVATAPTVTIDGVTVFDAQNWAAYQPQVTIQRFVTSSGGKHVNFYLFEYWRALALMKCKFIIAPDTAVVGASARSQYCRSYAATDDRPRLSSSSEFGNRWLKTEIMEWGLADAVIATSSFRAVLRQAVREMFALALRESQVRGELAVEPSSASGETELSHLATAGRTRFAFISESLGSYVVHDSLAQATSNMQETVAEVRFFEHDEDARRLQEIAPTIVICGASQVHMFANQLALLRFSELKVRDTDRQAAGESSPGSADEGAALSGGSHFFRGCPHKGTGANASTEGVRFAARQVVAYHEPNDLLSYYTSDRPGQVGSQNENTINVVVPFTAKWIWFLVADPGKAHTGQAGSDRLMNMVVCGHKAAERSGCGS